MFNFFKEERGVVTIIVTLMLIPAMLITGTAVDVARIMTARSIIQDANLLAANSAMTEYDAMLQDVYGLYGILETENDETLNNMIDIYIRTAILGEDWQTLELGTFQLFQGAIISTPSVESNQTLNTDVMRRQIEEYAKLRLPTIIVEDIISALSAFEKTKADTEVINKKLEIDGKLEKIFKIYNEIYDLIKYTLDKDDDFLHEAAEEDVNSYLQKIYKELTNLESLRLDYVVAHAAIESGAIESSAFIAENLEDTQEEYQAAYSAIKANLDSLINGGTVGSVWENGTYELVDDIRVFVTGSWSTNSTEIGLKKTLSNNIDTLKEFSAKYGDEDTFSEVANLTSNSKKVTDKPITGNRIKEIDGLDSHDSLVTKLLDLTVKADLIKDELKDDLDELESKLEDASDSLRIGMTGGTEEDLKNGESDGVDDEINLIEEYRKLIELYATDTSFDYGNNSLKYLNELIDALENFTYDYYGDGNGEFDGTYKTSLNNIASINDGFDKYVIDEITQNSEPDTLELLSMTEPPLFEIASNYILFKDISVKNKEFYDYLDELFGQERASTGKTPDEEAEDAKGDIFDAFETMQAEFKKLTGSDVGGATKFEGTISNSEEYEEGPVLSTDNAWDDKDNGIDKMLKDALSGNLLSLLGNFADDATNKLLLLGYATNTFSCYTTEKEIIANKDDASYKELKDEDVPLSINGIPISKSNNYFYESELEYLYNGDLKSAPSNVRSVLIVIMLIRFISNYASSFFIGVVNSEIAPLRVIPVFGTVVAELLRLAYALGESIYDVYLLVGGKSVPFLKTNKTWTFSISKIATIFTDTSKVKNDSSFGNLSYKHYLYFLLMIKNGDKLTERMSDLMSLNLTHIKINKGSDVEAMNAPKIEKNLEVATIIAVKNAITGFSVKTEIDLNMLFLRLPFAVQGVNDTVPPGKIRLDAIDMRGY